MNHEKNLTLRVPIEIFDRATELVDDLSADPEVLAAGRVTRSRVLRIALFQGLESLEMKYKREGKK